MTDWPAPLATGPLHATVAVPGSKSLTNRGLVLAALADGPSTIRGALRSRDADLMIDALRRMGVGIDESDDGTTLVVTPPDQLRGNITIDTGLAGTVMRFLPPLAALAEGPVAFDGDAQARERPMAGLLDALRALGVAVRATPQSSCASGWLSLSKPPDVAETRSVTDGRPTALPFVISGTGSVLGGEVNVDASASSQFVSALLMAAPRFKRGLVIRHVGATLPSLPHIEMTVAALRERGVVVDDCEPGAWRVAPGPIQALDVRVEPDLSNALPFLAAALVAGGSVTVPGWPAETTQPGGMVADILPQMGGQATVHDGALTVTGAGRINAVDLDLRAAGELAPNIAALCALADGTSYLRGIGHLRGHETDRLAALITEINRLGGAARETADGLEIVGAELRGGLFETYHDHRMATSGALLGLRVPGIVVQNIETTAKTLPGFAQMWTRMLGGVA